MFLVSANLPPPLPPPTPLSALFTQNFNRYHPYLPTRHPSPTQHDNLRARGPLSTTEKYMRFACGNLLLLALAHLLLAQTSVGGSGGDGFDIPSGALRPLLCLDGSGSTGCGNSQENGTPMWDLCPLGTMTVSPAGGGGVPAPALAVGLLALLWVWVLDGAVLPFRGRGWARWRAAAGRKGACRCRVCTLRMQARGRPLHDISISAKGAKKALISWS